MGLRVAHVCNYAPGLSGMYGTVRELLLAERKLGVEAEVIDDAGATQLYGLDGIMPVGLDYGNSADIICWHHAMVEDWLNEPHRNLVMFLHGTPEHNLFTELGSKDNVLSLIIGAANLKIPRAFVSMWKRHVPIWESLLQQPVNYIPSWVDLEKFQPVPPVVEPGVIRIGMMDFWRLTREPFGLFMAIDQLRKMTSLKIEVNVWGLTDQPSQTWKAVIQWLVEYDVVRLRGNTQDPIKDIYAQNDLILTMSTEETRVIREAYACGVPVVCGRHCPDLTRFSADGLYPEELAQQILVCHKKLTSKAGTGLRKQLRQYAEDNFDVNKASQQVVDLFSKVVETHGSPRQPRDPITGKAPRVRQVLPTAEDIRDRLLKKEPFTYVRFGDGDLILLGGLGDDSYHKGGEKIQAELKESFLIDDPNYLIGCSAGQINEGKMRRGMFARFDYNEKLQAVVDQYRPDQNFYNAVALSYQFTFDPKWFIDFLEKAVRGRRVFLVGGHAVVNNALVQAVFNAQSVYALPDRDAYYVLDQAVPDKVGTIYDDIKARVGKHDVVICAAGMATRVLAKRLWTDGIRTSFIDIGSLVDALAGTDTRTWIRMVGDDLRKTYSDVFLNRKTDIVVLTHGQEQCTKACFDAIRDCTGKYRVIWVDNGSPQESVDKVHESALTLKECDLIRSSENLGFSKAVNLALRKIFFEGSAEYIALVNNDVVVTPTWLDHMITTMEVNGLAAVGPVTSENNPHSVEALRAVIPDLPEFATANPGERAEQLWTQFGSKAVETGNMMSFFCCVMRRRTMEQVGLLDDNIFAYGEDNDYFERMKRLGLRFGIGLGCYVHHDHHATSSKFGDAWIQTRKQEATEYLKKKYG